MKTLSAALGVAALVAVLGATARDAAATLRNPCPRSAPYVRIEPGKALCSSGAGSGLFLVAARRDGGLH